MSKDIVVYAAGPWFTPNQDMVQTELEAYLRNKKGFKSYFPRHDGVKLEPGQFHDHNLREKVFLDNIHHIDVADIVIANLDGRDGFQDTGTCYEVGYAMALGIPIIGYQKDSNGKMNEHMTAVVDGFLCTCTGIGELDYALEGLAISNVTDNKEYPKDVSGSKVLYIAPDNTEVNISKSTEVASVIVECFGKDFRWVDKLSNKLSPDTMEELFSDVKFMLAVIDDRNPIVSWMMGQCFARHIPIISYTNYDYGVNLMLALSIIKHIKGVDELRETVQLIKREGLSAIKPLDTSNLKVF